MSGLSITVAAEAFLSARIRQSDVEDPIINFISVTKRMKLDPMIGKAVLADGDPILVQKLILDRYDVKKLLDNVALEVNLVPRSAVPKEFIIVASDFSFFFAPRAGENPENWTLDCVNDELVMRNAATLRILPTASGWEE
jgi:hypothetical protein